MSSNTTEPRMGRQCGLGWHDECSDPFGESCECECHPWVLRNDPADLVAAVAGLDGAEKAWWCCYENTAWGESEPTCDGEHSGYNWKCGWAVVVSLVADKELHIRAYLNADTHRKGNLNG